MKAPGYAWSCTFCGASNASGVDACSSCGKPAIARGVDVELAKGNAPRTSVGVIAIAKAHQRGLRVLFVAVTCVVLVLVTLEHFWPVNNRESFGFMILGASLPWSIAAFAVPHALFVAMVIAAGIGINSVILAIIALWWLRTLGFGK